MVEHLTFNQAVDGSIPSRPTTLHYESPRTPARPLVLVLVLLLPVLAQAQIAPARLIDGTLPAPPLPTVVAAGQEWLRVWVDVGGRVNEIEPLRETPAFSEGLRRAVRSWSFTPARVDGESVGSAVLVAALFRPAAVYALPGDGQPSLSLAPGPVPLPVDTPAPPYPPNAAGYGGAIVEVDVDAGGGVRAATVMTSRPGFDDAALDAARRWRFTPAMQDGQVAPSIAYLVFSFREPVVAPTQR